MTPDVQQAATVAAGTVQNAAHQAAASAGSVMEEAAERARPAATGDEDTQVLRNEP